MSSQGRNPVLVTAVILLTLLLAGCWPPKDITGQADGKGSFPPDQTFISLRLPKSVIERSNILGGCVNRQLIGSPPTSYSPPIRVLEIPSLEGFTFRDQRGNKVGLDFGISQSLRTSLGAEASSKLEVKLEGLTLIQPESDFDLPLAQCKMVFAAIVARSISISSESDFNLNTEASIEGVLKGLGLNLDVNYNAEENRYTAAFGTDLLFAVQTVNVKPDPDFVSPDYRVEYTRPGADQYFRVGGQQNRDFIVNAQQIDPLRIAGFFGPEAMYCLAIQVRQTGVGGLLAISPTYYCPSRDELLGNVNGGYKRDPRFIASLQIPSVSYQRNEEEDKNYIYQTHLSIIEPLFEVDPISDRTLRTITMPLELTVQRFNVSEIATNLD